MTKQRHILIAGGDTVERERLAEALQTGGAFRVNEVGNAVGGTARVQLCAPRFDAIIIDAALPDAPGPALCARIRRRGFRMPIIVLSDSANEAEIVRSLLLLCHKLLVRFDTICVRMEILTRGGGVWVSHPIRGTANHGWRSMSRC